jgi:hypothetical protein
MKDLGYEIADTIFIFVIDLLPGMKRFIAALLLPLLALSCGAKGNDGGNDSENTIPPVKVEIFPSRTVLVSSLELGTTLTHKTFNYPKNTEAVARAENLLGQAIDCIGQFTMDWGAGNTCPSKGNYNFTNLDKRVRLIRRLGKKVVLTFCRCPEWMRRDDPSKGKDAAPRVDMYDEFALMAADFIRHFKSEGLDIYAVNVWSETRGYWSHDLGRWELEDYAVLYNKVYAAIKQANPDVLVGGPFMHIESSPKGKDMSLFDGSISSSDRKALEAFIQNAVALDFFSIDRNLMENADKTPYGRNQVLSYTSFNGVVHKQLRELLEERFSDVPVWVVDNQCLKGHYPVEVEAAGLASMFRWHLLGGAAYVDKWQPEDEGSESTDTEQIAPEGLYTHTDSEDGARPLPSFYVFKAFRDFFPRGTRIVESVSSSEWVETLAGEHDMMLINKHGSTHNVVITVDGKEIETTLKGFEVKTIRYNE